MQQVNSVFLFVMLIMISGGVFAQNSIIRGNVFDEKDGNPIIYGNVFLEGKDIGTTTDLDGFFNLSNLDSGTYTLVVDYIGYVPYKEEITLSENSLKTLRIELSASKIELDKVSISARGLKAKKNVSVSSISVSSKEIQSLPSTGGEPDIAQYLPVLPGIIFSGDQGGQLYIRGGSPVQNKIMLDGMTLFNPFHSIGFFSVFETEAIKNAEVLTGGFNAEYGNRVSAIVDIETRTGNKKRISGIASVSPLQGKLLIEGPIVKLNETDGSSLSYLLTGKKSLLPYTSKALYSYAGEASLNGSEGLPYDYTDIYGKFSFLSGNGSEINAFGFSFNDSYAQESLASLKWGSYGAGIDMKIIPSLSNTIINGRFAFSDYSISVEEQGISPRKNNLTSYNFQIDFQNFGLNSEMRYGLGFETVQTDFQTVNAKNFIYEQNEDAIELYGFLSYKKQWGDFIFMPSFRVTYYASLSEPSFEPRLGMKYNITDYLRFKAAAGFYSQNLISSVNERDIVNLFVGFLLGPSSSIYDTQTGQPADSKLQKSKHIVGGFEVDLPMNITMNIEGYLKQFDQLIAINKGKSKPSESNYVTEIGDAYGMDVSFRYAGNNVYAWATYSLAYVNRNDGEQVYPTIFDRRHNVNLLTTYSFSRDKSWEASLRWNFGSGFPFTLTDGFYGNISLDNDVVDEVIHKNPDIGIIYDSQRNQGRLPYYHRLDASLKKTFTFSEYTSLELTGSITNVYNRNNIFYFDRIKYTRVDQLPILPSVSCTFKF